MADNIEASNPRPSLGEYLKDRRFRAGRSLRDIGQPHGLGSAYLSQLENGVITEPTISKFLSVVVAYDVPVQSVLADVYGVEVDRVALELARQKEAVDVGNLVLAYLNRSELILLVGLVGNSIIYSNGIVPDLFS